MNTVVVGVTGIGAGAALTAALTARGLRQLGADEPGKRPFLALAAFVGGLVGGAVLLASAKHEDWNLLPGFGIWGCVLAAAGLCDAVTHRVPTVLVRPSLVAVPLLLAVGFAATRDWQGLMLSGVGSFASAATMLFCWRFLQVGFGDVRLALLGGLGLGDASALSLCIGITISATIIAGQVATQRLRGHDGPQQLPLGPALAAGFIFASAL